jgi:hypothetical protein
VVPVTAHPKAQAKFDLDRTIGKSQNELSFGDSQPAPDAVVKEFEKLYGWSCFMALKVLRL